MATPTPTHINPTAPRKLPIKRKTQPQPQIQSPNPNPNPNPNFPYPSEEDYEFDDEDEDEAPNPNPNPNQKTPPFKFHRIWSEPDEIRFLQGLLGCYSQGLVFPRDLNVFYDRFSESMPQPYTRSQLSEKLRRLRKKYRIVSGRIGRGQDPSRLAPHDRDLLHLCTRLWHPDHASASPFSAAGTAAAASNGNKRRRANPRPPPVLAVDDLETEDETVAVLAAVPPAEINTGTADASGDNRRKSGSKGELEMKVDCFAAKTVLDVFEKSLEEVRMCLATGDDELARKWREQRVAELDVFARRLRLVLEPSLC